MNINDKKLDTYKQITIGFMLQKSLIVSLIGSIFMVVGESVGPGEDEIPFGPLSGLTLHQVTLI